MRSPTRTRCSTCRSDGECGARRSGRVANGGSGLDEREDVGVDDVRVRGQHEVEQLCVPVVGREGPAVVEDDGLGVDAAPVLVVDLRAVFGGDVGNDRSSGSCAWVRSIRACSRQPRHPLTRSYICTDVRGGDFRGYAGRARPSGRHGAVVQWQNFCFPSRQRGFDSRQPLHFIDIRSRSHPGPGATHETSASRRVRHSPTPPGLRRARGRRLEHCSSFARD